MNLKSYLDLFELLKTDTSSREERRAFGLVNVLTQNRPIEQLLAWVRENNVKLKNPKLSETFSSTLYSVTLILVIFTFILGFISGVGLLSYSGHEPVNVIYFIAMVVFLPLFTMILSLFSMFRANSIRSMLVHISPAFWMEKILRLLPNKMENSLNELQINPLLANWIVIKRSQIIALAFSFGLLFALLGVVATQDIAFAWSTTLSIEPEEFHTFLETLSFPWKDFYPAALPSVELIEQSQYYRLGDKLSAEMIHNASKLGEWWKFLVFATFFYAILLRFAIYLLSEFGLNRAIKKSFLTLDGVEKLLNDMNEPIISTHANENERQFIQRSTAYAQTIFSLDASYDSVQGWAIPKENLLLVSESMKVISPKLFEVGGANTLDEDMEIIYNSHGEVLLYVKSWEPPTMDFIDYLEGLVRSVDKVIVCPIGTVENAYKTESREVNVWARKLSIFKNEKVWLKSSSAKALGGEALNAES
jgi:hypothetical protein